MHALVTLNVNGDRHTVGVPSHFTLLETLRYALGLTGTKQGCDKGDCGACTVLLNGEPVLSCITPVWEAENRPVLTVEGLASAAGPHRLQSAFADLGAAQCGFCTPGILISARALLDHTSRPTRHEIQEALSGNLCRCTGYTKILDAVERAAELLAGGGVAGQKAGPAANAPAPMSAAPAASAAAHEATALRPAPVAATRPDPAPHAREVRAREEAPRSGSAGRRGDPALRVRTGQDATCTAPRDASGRAPRDAARTAAATEPPR